MRVGLKELLYVLKVLTSVYPILSQQGGQAWHRLSGEVPNSMQHISGMDPVVVCGE